MFSNIGATYNLRITRNECHLILSKNDNGQYINLHPHNYPSQRLKSMVEKFWHCRFL